MSVEYDVQDTKKIQSDVLALIAAMSDEFRQQLMHSFLWTEETLAEYLHRDAALSGDAVKDAYSHLESLLARIESYANEESRKIFPTYDQWVDEEYQKYKSDLAEDREDISRLMDEGGQVAPNNTSPLDTMANDSLSHYNHLLEEHNKQQRRIEEASRLMLSPHYKNLRAQADKMNEIIKADITR